MSNLKLAATALGGTGLAAALYLATPMVEKWEGTSLDPYKDIVGINTVCTGETRVQMRRYTPAECKAMLRRALESDYAPAVLKVVPAIKDKPYPFAASISFAYNLGPANYARSTIARRFNAGDWKGGCEAITIKVWSAREKRMVMGWAQAGGREIRGLVNRREDERKLCLKGL